MKRHWSWAVVALAAMGCQQETTTGPAGTTSTTPPTTTPSTPMAPSTTPAPSTTDPADPKKLTVMTKESHTVTQGDTDNVLVTINRDNFDDAVTIKLDGLPAGVALQGTSPVIAKGENSATLVLNADATAAVGEHAIQLTAEAPGIEKNVQSFKLKIVAKN